MELLKSGKAERNFPKLNNFSETWLNILEESILFF